MEFGHQLCNYALVRVSRSPLPTKKKVTLKSQNGLSRLAIFNTLLLLTFWQFHNHLKCKSLNQTPSSSPVFVSRLQMCWSHQPALNSLILHPERPTEQILSPHYLTFTQPCCQRKWIMNIPEKPSIPNSLENVWVESYKKLLPKLPN